MNNVTKIIKPHNKNMLIIILLLSYFLFNMLIPVINITKYIHTKNFYTVIKIYNFRSILATDTTTYITTQQFLARQINNNNLQSYITDLKNSILKLNDFKKNENNKIYSYDAYGNSLFNPHINGNKSFIPNYLQYNGERTDNNTSLQYLRARFYNFILKRFINADTFDLLNKFNYVNANPVINIDSSGHMLQRFISARRHRPDEMVGAIEMNNFKRSSCLFTTTITTSYSQARAKRYIEENNLQSLPKVSRNYHEDYFTPSKRSVYELPHYPSNQMLIFIVSPSGKVKLHVDSEYDRSGDWGNHHFGPNHKALAGDNPIVCAGRVYLTDNILFLSLISANYKPPMSLLSHCKQIFILYDFIVRASDTTDISDFKNFIIDTKKEMYSRKVFIGCYYCRGIYARPCEASISIDIGRHIAGYIA